MKQIIIGTVAGVIIIVFILLTGGCTYHNIQKGNISYTAWTFLADTDKLNGYGIADEDSIEISFGESKSTTDPNVVKAAVEGVVEGLKGI